MTPADKTAAKAAAERAAGEAEVRARIAQMPEPMRGIGQRLHELIMANGPGLAPRVRYGMPWYMRDGKSWCFFRAADKFGFVTLGFDDPAVLAVMAGAPHRLVVSAYRITELDEGTEAEIAGILRAAPEG